MMRAAHVGRHGCENALLQLFVHVAAPASMWGDASLSAQTCMLAMIKASSMLLYSTQSH